MKKTIQRTTRIFVSFLSLSIMVVLISACAESTQNNKFIDNASYNQAGTNNSYYHAVEQYKIQYNENPDSLASLLLYVRALRYVGQSEEALQKLKNSKDRFGNHPAFLTEIGKLYLTKSDLSQAKKNLNKAIAKNDDNWEAHSALAITHDMHKNYSHALVSYNKALLLCPNSASILNNMAISASLTGDMATARSLLAKAASLRPHSQLIKNNLTLMRKVGAVCHNCSADEYSEIINRTIVAQDWATSDLSCTTTIDEIIEALSKSNFIDLKVEFDFDKATLRPEAMRTLDTLGRAVTSDQLKYSNFDLEGHTDAIGPASYNQTLSERRAKAVKKYLVDIIGIDASRLNPVGYGESRLLDKENPNSGVNRRVRVFRQQ